VLYKYILVVKIRELGNLVVLRVVRVDPSGFYFIGVTILFLERCPKVYLSL